MSHAEMRALRPGEPVLACLPFRGSALHTVTVTRVNRETADVIDAAGRVHRVQWHGLRALAEATT